MMLPSPALSGAQGKAAFLFLHQAFDAETIMEALIPTFIASGSVLPPRAAKALKRAIALSSSTGFPIRSVQATLMTHNRKPVFCHSDEVRFPPHNKGRACEIASRVYPDRLDILSAIMDIEVALSRTSILETLIKATGIGTSVTAGLTVRLCDGVLLLRDEHCHFQIGMATPETLAARTERVLAIVLDPVGSGLALEECRARAEEEISTLMVRMHRKVGRDVTVLDPVELRMSETRALAPLRSRPRTYRSPKIVTGEPRTVALHLLQAPGMSAWCRSAMSIREASDGRIIGIVGRTGPKPGSAASHLSGILIRSDDGFRHAWLDEIEAEDRLLIVRHHMASVQRSSYSAELNPNAKRGRFLTAFPHFVALHYHPDTGVDLRHAVGPDPIPGRFLLGILPPESNHEKIGLRAEIAAFRDLLQRRLIADGSISTLSLGTA